MFTWFKNMAKKHRANKFHQFAKEKLKNDMIWYENDDRIKRWDVPSLDNFHLPPKNCRTQRSQTREAISWWQRVKPARHSLKRLSLRQVSCWDFQLDEFSQLNLFPPLQEEQVKMEAVEATAEAETTAAAEETTVKKKKKKTVKKKKKKEEVKEIKVPELSSYLKNFVSIVAPPVAWPAIFHTSPFDERESQTPFWDLLGAIKLQIMICKLALSRLKTSTSRPFFRSRRRGRASSSSVALRTRWRRARSRWPGTSTTRRSSRTTGGSSPSTASTPPSSLPTASWRTWGHTRSTRVNSNGESLQRLSHKNVGELPLSWRGGEEKMKMVWKSNTQVANQF